MTLQLEQCLSLEEKIELLKTAVFVSSEDDDYFVLKVDAGYVAVVCESRLDRNWFETGDLTTVMDHRVNVISEPTASRDEAIVTALWYMTGDNGGEDARNRNVARFAPMVKHYA